MTNKKQNSINSTTLLAFLLGAILLFGVYYLGYLPPRTTGVDKSLTDDFAQVSQIQNIYVFLESRPANKYTSLGTFQGDNAIEMLQSIGIGKEKFGNVLLNMLNTGNQNLNLYEVINKMVEGTKEKYPEASGIIFSDRLKKCEVIKF